MIAHLILCEFSTSFKEYFHKKKSLRNSCKVASEDYAATFYQQACAWNEQLQTSLDKAFDKWSEVEALDFSEKIAM